METIKNIQFVKTKANVVNTLTQSGTLPDHNAIKIQHTH